jgi:hypothetical protein
MGSFLIGLIIGAAIGAYIVWGIMQDKTED